MNYVNQINVTGEILKVSFYEKESVTALRLSVATKRQVKTADSALYTITTWHNVTLFDEQARELKDKALKNCWVKVTGQMSQKKFHGKIYNQILPDSIEILPN